MRLGPSGRKTFANRPRTEGLWVRLRFVDNDVLEGMMPNELTQRLGYFAQEGLDVTLIDEASGQSSEDQVLADQVQAGSGSYNHTIELQAAGKNIECVVQLDVALSGALHTGRRR